MKTNKKVAIKLVHLNYNSQYAIRTLAREIEILSHLTKSMQNGYSTKLKEVIVPEELDIES